MLIFSGTTLPVEVMPKAMQKIVGFFPLTQGITMMKHAFLGIGTGTVLLPVCVMGYAMPIFSRVLQYFQVYLCVYFANRLSRKAGRNWQLLLICSMAAFAIYAFTIHLLRTPEWYTTYPFVFCWNN